MRGEKKIRIVNTSSLPPAHNDQELITIARVNTPFEGHIIKERLAANGIPAFIRFEHGGAIPELTGNFIGGVEVQVPVMHEETTLHLLSIEYED